MTQTKITVYKFGNTPSLALEGWDFDAVELDYTTQRAKALYEALGADPEDYEYSLALHRPTGRWGLFGLRVEGHDFAVEGKL